MFIFNVFVARGVIDFFVLIDVFCQSWISVAANTVINTNTDANLRPQSRYALTDTTIEEDLEFFTRPFRVIFAFLQRIFHHHKTLNKMFLKGYSFLILEVFIILFALTASGKLVYTYSHHLY